LALNKTEHFSKVSLIYLAAPAAVAVMISGNEMLDLA
jgi:hypothetical protein